MGYLVLVRHGQSEWNMLGKWTGLTDTELTENGRVEAKHAASHLHDIVFHKAHTSKLKRAQQTLGEIKSELVLHELETIEHEALNERDYGHHTGKNKWEVKEQIGEEEFTKLRRHWDHPVPGGETLKDVHNRTIPYFEKHIMDDLKNGKNIIVTAHGNSLRTIMKHLEDIADEDAHTVEIGTGAVLVYAVNEDGKIVAKELRTPGGHA
jgi:2,3-bisphosphoglycerate-dependent phosphoglycerate mutase